MIRILTALTLATTGIVVGVVAGYLIAVAAALIRANRNLSELVPRLEAIRDNTAPLDGDLAAVNGAVGQLVERLASVDKGLDTIARLAGGK